LTVIVVIGGMVALVVVRLRSDFDHPFDSAAWKLYRVPCGIASHDHDLSRWEMVPDLTANHLRSGMTKDEVVRLLGSPEPPGDALPNLPWSLGSGDTSNPDAVKERIAKSEFYYYLGRFDLPEEDSDTRRLYTDWMVVKFDDRARLSSTDTVKLYK
jgi:hypothetical protein